MFKDQDDGSDWEFRGEGRDQARVDIGGSDMLESPGNSA